MTSDEKGIDITVPQEMIERLMREQLAGVDLDKAIENAVAKVAFWSSKEPPMVNQISIDWLPDNPRYAKQECLDLYREFLDSLDVKPKEGEHATFGKGVIYCIEPINPMLLIASLNYKDSESHSFEAEGPIKRLNLSNLYYKKNYSHNMAALTKFCSENNGNLKFQLVGTDGWGASEGETLDIVVKK